MWQIPAANTALVEQVKNGTAMLADLTGGGATQVGCTGAPYHHAAIPATFPANGAYTEAIYAVSIPGVLPSACVSAYQALAACQLSGKRLMSNAEWTQTAVGTPSAVGDNGTTNCATNSPGPIDTGSRSGCVSAVGAFDMVGNVSELTPDSGASFRGGDFGNGTDAGLFTRGSLFDPTSGDSAVGFRCAR
ncbi:MAG: hypothetical protein HY271_00800 [Deltaproteobacteria bacterium]|nr:hypothetical protein [Deltaproteobacteria bacterium]